MFKLVRDLGPLAIGVALFGLVIWFLFERNMAIGDWLLAAFLVGHGWIHVMYIMPRQQPKTVTAAGPSWPFELDHSWALSGLGLTGGALRALGIVLVSVTVVGYFLAGLAAVPFLVPAAAWAGLVLIATAASVILMVLFFHPGLLIGLAIDAVLLWLVVLSTWRPT